MKVVLLISLAFAEGMLQTQLPSKLVLAFRNPVQSSFTEGIDALGGAESGNTPSPKWLGLNRQKKSNTVPFYN